MKLTEQLAQTNSRTTALENDRLRNQREISRITKIYGGLSVSVSISFRIHKYINCGSARAVCGNANAIV